MDFVNTGRLRVAYREHGNPSGEPLFLLHGWPDDVHTWDAILPALAAEGWRIIVPSLRGFGETRFLDHETPRSGQLSALAQDLFDLATALDIERFSVIGHDWGARAAYNAALLEPTRVARCVAISVGWGTNTPGQTLSLVQAKNYWYHWYMATDRGAEALRKERREFARLLWQSWSPSWHFSDGEFHDTMHAWDNPDWAAITIHSYRHRWGLAPSDPLYAQLEERLHRESVINVPTLVLHGTEDGANSPQTSEHKDHLFSGPYQRILLPGAGHFPQREHPQAVSSAILGWLHERQVS
ncbi:alpha/beta fold hydrolase [Pseudoduganella sp. RAF53_2]|uniref:alpha/beta fold hydrolase n=1 Tax=unclassified Pseudoduganella TaxID=2637179 RepID=UPI003F997B11